MTKLRYSVLIPDADSGHALIVARCLAQAGARICALARDPRAALRFSRRTAYFRRELGHTLGAAPFSMEFIQKEIRSSRSDVFLPIDECAHEFAINHRRKLEQSIRLPPLASAYALRIATHKDRLAHFLATERIPAPRTVSIDLAGLEEQLDINLEFPLIAKPACGNGGKGIEIIESKDALRRFIANPHRAPFGRYILQQFIRGHDIDLSALCVKGEIVAYTIQRGVVARTRNFAASAGVEFLEAPRLLSIVARMLRQLDYSGIAHIDARYDEDADDFKIIEINARYWGSLVASLKAGINFPDLACRWALGEELVASTYRNTRFMDALSFTKQIFGKPAVYSSRGFRVAETDLAFILSDPIAELVNVFNRRA